MINESLAMCNNFLHTGQVEKAVPMLGVLKKVIPDDDRVDYFFRCITREHLPDAVEAFGENWKGEDLEGKSIQVFCDQGMGDTINMLRYLAFMKFRYAPCEIVLNCYAYYDEFKDLIESLHYVDHFVNDNKRCDYHTNVLSLPSIIQGLDYDFHYPVHFRDVLKKTIPPSQPIIEVEEEEWDGVYKIGLAWKSNSKNDLHKKKSFPLELFKERVTFNKDYEVYSLIPEKTGDPYLKETELNSLMDTAKLIKKVNWVISVDTVVLHLAGAMGKDATGLLPHFPDPRWGERQSEPWYSVWYPSVELVSQTSEGDWFYPLDIAEKYILGL